MRYDLIIAGVGGQGIITIAKLIGHAALEEGFDAKQSEVHGMSQRGGSVVTEIRIANYPIASNVIELGEAELILSMEPMEALRYLPWLKPTGWLLTNDQPVINIENYPDPDILFNEIERVPNHLLFNAEKIAHKSGSSKAINMVLLGAVMPHLPIRKNTMLNSIKYFFRNKEDKLINANLIAFESGLDFGIKMLESHSFQNRIYYDH